MKTRSGVMRMPPTWPSLYQARARIREIQTVKQMRRNFDMYYSHALERKTVHSRRLLTLIMSEMILKYQIFLDTQDGQFMVNSIIKCLVTVPDLKEYTQKLKVLSDSHRLDAKKAYIEFFMTGLTCPDAARSIAKFVV